MAEPGGLPGLFKEGGAAQQLLIWGVIQQLLGALLGPPLNAVEQQVNRAFPDAALPVADAVDAALKGHRSSDDAAAEAQLSGFNRLRFDLLLASAGEPPGAEQLVAMLRRGIIPEAGRGPDAVTYEQGILESRLKLKWAGALQRLGEVPLPPADAVDAVVESQISYDDGQARALLSGVSAETFRIMVDTRGNPPTPTELDELYRRGLIPLEGTGPSALSYQQGIFEGSTRNKWWRLMSRLGEYIPPPRTVTAMVREGSLSDAEAMALWRASGLTQDLAAAYLASAHHQRLSSTKELAKSDIERLYQDQVIGRDDASGMLVALDYSTAEANLILAVVDVRRQVAALNQAISRVHALYVGRRIERGQVVTALDALHVASSQRDQLLESWDVERFIDLKQLSSAEIVNAEFYKVISVDDAMARLQGQGWSEVDAFILLSVRHHAPIGPPPEGLALPAGG